jgi:hypothetical protein
MSKDGFGFSCLVTINFALCEYPRADAPYIEVVLWIDYSTVSRYIRYRDKMDIKRRASSRVAPRSGAIAYGIEGSKVVLATLERTKSEDDIAFLQPVADNATALLCAMRVRISYSIVRRFY